MGLGTSYSVVLALGGARYVLHWSVRVGLGTSNTILLALGYAIYVLHWTVGSSLFSLSITRADGRSIDFVLMKSVLLERMI